jgi:uncharacterized protein (DUF427 family)
MAKAIWNGAVVAESNETIQLEGNTYFPPDSLHREFFEASQTHTVCPWKGQASYLNITVDGQTNRDASWTYPEPNDAAERIGGYIAFWRGVKIEA